MAVHYGAQCVYRGAIMPANSTSERNQKDSRLNLRTSIQQQQLIRSAAAAQDKSVTDFVLESATTNAERVLADRRWFIISTESWNALGELLDAPAAETPRLSRLLSEPTVFDVDH
jgi:uncharacterized protein (DUF1778 family)